MAHIAMVTLDHPPDDDRIFHKEAKGLLDAGHQVSILCVADADGNIPSMAKGELLNPQGDLIIEQEGITIKAVKAPQNRKEKTLKKALLGGFVRRFVRAGQTLAPNVFHAHEPSSLYLALKMAHGDSGRVVFDSHESWLSGSSRDFWIKREVLPKLQYLITANQLTRGHLLSRNPKMATKIIYNYPESRIFNYPFRSEKFQQPIIAHEGILPFNRGLKRMIEALVQLKVQYPGILLRIVGEVKGDERQYLNHKMSEHNLYDNIEITGWVPYEAVPDYLKDAAIGLIVKTPKPLNNLMGGPAIKLFNYMASGMAVVDAGLPESTRFLDEIGAGITLRDRSATTLTNAIVYLLTNPGLMQQYAERGWEASQNLKWEKEAEKLVNFYRRQVLAPSKGFLAR